VPFFDELDPDSREAIRAQSLTRRYPKGSLLFAEADPAHEVLVITAGAVKVVVTAASGREVVLDVLEAGELLGEMSAIDGGQRSATALALGPVEVLAVSQRAFVALLDGHPALARKLLSLLTARIRGADRRQLEFGANDALGRVCQRLVELSRRYGFDEGDGRVVLVAPLSQQDLASWAGLSREAVVKGLRALRTLGWVESDGRRLVIVDPQALSRRALA
jgi:CRP-like cAMP-binding protein